MQREPEQGGGHQEEQPKKMYSRHSEEVPVPCRDE